MYSININVALSFNDESEIDQERIQKIMSVMSSLISNSKNWDDEKKRNAFMGAEEMLLSAMINSSIDSTLGEGESVKMVTPRIPLEVKGAYTNQYMDKIERIPNPGGKKAFAFTLKEKEKPEPQEDQED